MCCRRSSEPLKSIRDVVLRDGAGMCSAPSIKKAMEELTGPVAGARDDLFQDSGLLSITVDRDLQHRIKLIATEIAHNPAQKFREFNRRGVKYVRCPWQA